MKYLAFMFLTIFSVLPAISQPPSYDPMPRKPAAQSSGFLDSSLALINPKNTDYGCQIDTERQFVVEQTLKNLEFWIVGITVSLLIVSFFMLLHESRERDRREIIAAGLLAHYHNAWVDARSHADNTIRRHNELVKRTNAAAESALRASQEAGQMLTKPEQNGSLSATKSSTQQSATPKDGARATDNRENKSNSSRQSDEVEVDSVAQISVLQKQLDASREREANLKKQLAAAERRYRRLESNDTAVSG